MTLPVAAAHPGHGRSVFIVVTHLLGVGHVTRAAMIGRALAANDWRVTLVSGGRRVPTIDVSGLNLVQLPPVHCRDADFRTLLDDDGMPVTPCLMLQRRDMLLAACTAARSDVIILELFPFGRRQLAPECTALLEHATQMVPRPAILCSIRDILAPPSKPERALETLERLGLWFDAVLVHGDPAVVPLDASWPVDPALARRLFYTGYVADAVVPDQPILDQPANTASDGEIVVSAGGSAAGWPLLQAALEAARLMPRQQPWRLLVGRSTPVPIFEALIRDAPPHVCVEWARPDFRTVLSRAALSISQAGYNTMLDLAAIGVRAIVVPYAQGRETEQSQRAACFAELGLVQALPEAELSGAAIAAAALRLLDRPQPGRGRVQLDGASRTVRVIGQLADKQTDIHNAWTDLDLALERARQSGRLPPFWWRDDDTIEPSPALDRLLALARDVDVPLTLAAIPERATPQLASRLRREGARIDVCPHGWAHTNHAPDHDKKAELGTHRAMDVMMADLARGLVRIGDLCGDQALAVITPPWNRYAPEVIAELSAVGFVGLSAYRRRARARVHGIAIVNTHLDPIAWKNGGGLVNEASLVRGLAHLIDDGMEGRADASEPIGLLTHHLDHDPWVWRFVARLTTRLAGAKGARFISLREAVAAA